MIVVDTNVIAYFWLPGVYTACAERALKKDNEWAAPILWRSEFAIFMPVTYAVKILLLIWLSSLWNMQKNR
jgi:hypothetical protein